MFWIIEATNKTTNETIEWAFGCDSSAQALEQFRRHFDEEWVVTGARMTY